MGRYSYQAVDHVGKLFRGSHYALNEADLEKSLARQGLTLIKSKIVKEGRFSLFLSSGKIDQRILAEFYRRFGQTIDMGLPILAGLEENAKVMPSRTLKRISEEIKVALEDGRTLAGAMSQFPAAFTKLELGLISMGEQSGVLPQCMDDIAAFLEWKEEIKSIIKRAMIYPSFILLSILGVIAVWMGFVLPQLSAILLDMGVELPGITKAVFACSQFIQNSWFSLIIGTLIFLLLFFLFKRTQRGGRIVSMLQLKIPLIGPIVSNIVNARLSRNFATMHRAGITLPKMFEIITDGVLGNVYLEQKVIEAYKEVEKGKSLGESFDTVGHFPPLLVSGLRHGEVTGNLEDCFRRLGDYYDNEVRRSVSVMISALEPITLLLLGGIFGLIILSILMPLYDVLADFGKAY